MHGAEVHRPDSVACPESSSTRGSRGSSTEATSTMTDDALEGLTSDMTFSACELVPQLPAHGPGSRPPSERETLLVGTSSCGDGSTTTFNEQDLIEQMVTRPYDCRAAVQIAFDASLGLEDVSTLETRSGDFFNG